MKLIKMPITGIVFLAVHVSFLPFSEGKHLENYNSLNLRVLSLGLPLTVLLNLNHHNHYLLSEPLQVTGVI